VEVISGNPGFELVVADLGEERGVVDGLLAAGVFGDVGPSLPEGFDGFDEVLATWVLTDRGDDFVFEGDDLEDVESNVAFAVDEAAVVVPEPGAALAFHPRRVKRELPTAPDPR